MWGTGEERCCRQQHEYEEERKMPESIYKVIEIIGSSPTSWEEAASNAIKEASKHVKDLRVAEIKTLDIHMLDDGTLAYRTKLDVSFRYHGEG